MTLAAIKITVYFVGLVNFSMAGTTVIVPLTSSGVTGADMVSLERHTSELAIRGLQGGSSMCAALGMSTGLTANWKSSTCTLHGVSDKWITLPTSSTPFKAEPSFARVPGLCGRRVLTLDPSYKTASGKYAARLDLDSGKLEACTHDGAWVSSLTLDNATGNFLIGASKGAGTTVPLDDGAELFLLNAPTSPGTDGRAHFYWYYQMYTPSSGACKEMPNLLTSCDSQCTADFPAPHDAASGVGCSNSAYP